MWRRLTLIFTEKIFVGIYGFSEASYLDLLQSGIFGTESDFQTCSSHPLYLLPIYRPDYQRKFGLEEK